MIIEATFALPIYRWKPHEELTEEIHSFLSDSLNDGYTPILLAYNLGKARFTLRFPRFRAIRKDLRPSEVNTLKDVEKLYGKKMRQKLSTQSEHLSFLYKRDDSVG